MDGPTTDEFFAAKKVVNDWKAGPLQLRASHIKNVIQRTAARQLPGNGWLHAVYALKEIHFKPVITTVEQAKQVPNRVTTPLIGADLAGCSAPYNTLTRQRLDQIWVNLLQREGLLDVTAQLVQKSPGPDFAVTVSDLLSVHQAIWTQWIDQSTFVQLQQSNPSNRPRRDGVTYQTVIFFEDLLGFYYLNPKQGGAPRVVKASEFRQMLSAPHFARAVVAL